MRGASNLCLGAIDQAILPSGQRLRSCRPFWHAARWAPICRLNSNRRRQAPRRSRPVFRERVRLSKRGPLTTAPSPGAASGFTEGSTTAQATIRTAFRSFNGNYPNSVETLISKNSNDTASRCYGTALDRPTPASRARSASLPTGRWSSSLRMVSTLYLAARQRAEIAG
jgi:hypothetical protein